jgi:hypothetical protein
MNLAEFRTKLQTLMDEPGLRPFVCDGSPLTCRAFIVGFNPATSMDRSFWDYWSNDEGFAKAAFMRDYLAKRGLTQPKGVRARIERIVAQAPRGTFLETNICSKPTRTAAELAKQDRQTAVFRFLLEAVRPELVYVHSNDPIAYLSQLTGVAGLNPTEPRTATYVGHSFVAFGTPGPLFRMGFSEAEQLGKRLVGHLAAAA